MKCILMTLCLTIPLAAQQPPGGGQRPPQMSYDTSKEITLQGTVSAVKTHSQGPGKLVGITLQTTAKAYEIMVAPDFVLSSKGFTLASGDEVTVLCAPAGRGYMARQITRGTETITLLDENGKPVGGASGGRGETPQGPPPQEQP